MATDATTAPFFADTIGTQRLASFFDFVTGPEIWSGIGHNRFRFAISSITGGERVAEARLSFYNRHPRELGVAGRSYVLAATELSMLNPNTGTLPIFETRRDADITLRCYRRHPVLVRDSGANPWGLTFGTLFHMAGDSRLFRTSEDLEALGARFDGWAWESDDRQWLPLYEAKMLHHWNDRFSSYAHLPEGYRGTALPRLEDAALDDPEAAVLTRYWVEKDEVLKAVPGWWNRDWLLGWRDIVRADDFRTFVTSAMPLAATGDPFLMAFPVEPRHGPLLQAVWSSFMFDFISRQKLSGTHMKYFTAKQLAAPEPRAFVEFPPWSQVELGVFVRARVLELTYTSRRMADYAADTLEEGASVGAPFRWNSQRRAQLRAELEAAMLHLYGMDRADAEYVLDSFPIARRNEERDHGEFRTKRLVLTVFDAMATAAQTGVPYMSPIDPPPGQGPRHPERTT